MSKEKDKMLEDANHRKEHGDRNRRKEKQTKVEDIPHSILLRIVIIIRH